MLKTDILAEVRLPLGQWVPDMWGTADVIKVTHRSTEVLRLDEYDFKYGQGVKVYADNPQNRCYGVASCDVYLDQHNPLHHAVPVVLHIVQPRLQHFDRYETTAGELWKWAETVLQPAAEATRKAEAALVPGAAQCRFCRARHVCKARSEHNIRTAVDEFADKDLEFIDDDDLSRILKQIPDIKQWISDVQAEAERRLMAGEHVSGYKLVYGRSQRRWTDDSLVAVRLLDLGWREDDFTESKLRSPAQIEKELGPTVFQDMMADLVSKPQGKLTVASDDDPRAEVVRSNPEDDFA